MAWIEGTANTPQEVGLVLHNGLVQNGWEMVWGEAPTNSEQETKDAIYKSASSNYGDIFIGIRYLKDVAGGRFFIHFKGMTGIKETTNSLRDVINPALREPKISFAPGVPVDYNFSIAKTRITGVCFFGAYVQDFWMGCGVSIAEPGAYPLPYMAAAACEGDFTSSPYDGTHASTNNEENSSFLFSAHAGMGGVMVPGGEWVWISNDWDTYGEHPRTYSFPYNFGGSGSFKESNRLHATIPTNNTATYTKTFAGRLSNIMLEQVMLVHSASTYSHRAMFVLDGICRPWGPVYDRQIVQEGGSSYLIYAVPNCDNVHIAMEMR